MNFNLTTIDASAIIAHGKLWYQGQSPSVLHIEDDKDSQEILSGRLKKRFPAAGYKAVVSIEGCKKTLSNSTTKYDFWVLDHVIQLRDNDSQLAESDGKDLSDFLRYVIYEGETKCDFLIRVTAFPEPAHFAMDRVIKSLGGEIHPLRFGALIWKVAGWSDLVLAYIYRHLVLTHHQKLMNEINCFELDRLNGTKPMARKRHGRFEGSERFDAFVKELCLWWPFLSRWPQDSMETKVLLSPLIKNVLHYFIVDDSSLEDDLGEGETTMTLKFRPGDALQ